MTVDRMYTSLAYWTEQMAKVASCTIAYANPDNWRHPPLVELRHSGRRRQSTSVSRSCFGSTGLSRSQLRATQGRTGTVRLSSPFSLAAYVPNNYLRNGRAVTKALSR